MVGWLGGWVGCVIEWWAGNGGVMIMVVVMVVMVVMMVVGVVVIMVMVVGEKVSPISIYHNSRSTAPWRRYW